MERLTMLVNSHLLDNGKLDKEYDLNNKIQLNEYSCMDIPNAVYNKLGELEDVLEKYGIENLEEYISALIEARKFSIEESEINFKRHIEETTKREKLEQELAELKQKAIVPKYQVGQTLFRLDFGSIIPFVVNEVYVNVKADKNMSIQYFDYVGLAIEENELFTTREEAVQNSLNSREKNNDYKRIN